MRASTSRVAVLFLWIVFVCLCGCSQEDKESAGEANRSIPQKSNLLEFGGGPPGGTFNYFSSKMAALISKANDNMAVTAVETAGSGENLRRINTELLDMGIVYGGDAFLGRKGRLAGEGMGAENVRALAFLYGAPVQLVVRRGKGIVTVNDLAGKRVAIGNRDSGAALSAERFFRHLGLWDKMEIVHKGYIRAVADFVSGDVDAFWVLAGYPNASILEAIFSPESLLLGVHEAAEFSGFYSVYPFYTLMTIPAGTYPGQDKDVDTFQDIALWCARSGLDSQLVYEAMCAVYCSEGLKSVKAFHRAGREMSVENGVRGVSIPLHPGAARFWDERGVAVPPSLRP